MVQEEFLPAAQSSSGSTKKKKRKRKGHYNRGSYVSTKTGQVCKYRSGWELSYMQWLDVNVDVLTWSYETIIIDYVSNKRTGKLRKYYPDLYVHYVDGTKQLIEIKPSSRLHQAKVQKKLSAANDWCRTKGLALIVITEVELKKMGLL
jgi:hypothetical protein